MTREEARKILRGKTLQELIDLWNEDCRSHGMFMSTAHKMSDNSWWNELFRKNSSAWHLINDLLGSGEQFNTSDMWFFWDEETCSFTSFSTAQELLETPYEELFIKLIIKNH